MEIFSTIVGLLVSIIAVIISVFSLKQTQKSIEEANRPYVVIYRDYIQINNTVHEYLIIKNFGKSGAVIDSIKFEPEFKDKILGNRVFSNINNTFIAPGQSISTVTAPNAFEGERNGVIIAKIDYHLGKVKYEDSISLNEDLIKDLLFTKSNASKNTSLETIIAKASEEILRRNL